MGNEINERGNLSYLMERVGLRQLEKFIWRVTNRRVVEWLDEFQY